MFLVFIFCLFIFSRYNKSAVHSVQHYPIIILHDGDIIIVIMFHLMSFRVNVRYGLQPKGTY